jgi:hypothetical protein
MNNIFVIAAIVSLVFLIIKFIEMRFIEKESKPFKLLFRDTLLVYFSVIASDFLIGQINPMIQSTIKGGSHVTPVFTDNPGF